MSSVPLCPPPAARAEPSRDYGDGGDDDILAAVLIRMWSLASGRVLRAGLRPEELGEEELIRFWADDMTASSGRHAAARPEGM
jgi:hypothetical protein